jgi:hypothetical protein
VHPVRHPPRLGLEDYLGWLRLAKETAPELHLHAYSAMEIAHMCDVTGLPPAEVFARLRDAGLGSTPGTAAEVLHDGVRERISPNKLPVARWVEIIEASHRAGLRSTATVMFGHIEEPWELAEHLRVVRELQERTGGFTEFVPLSFIPFQTLLGRTHGVEELSREENLKHTAVFRLALGRTVPSLQASWVKMGLDAATARAVLGRQRPRRNPDGGEHLPPGRLAARRPPRPARAHRRRPRAGAPPPSARRSTRSAAAGPSARPAARPRARAGRGRAMTVTFGWKASAEQFGPAGAARAVGARRGSVGFGTVAVSDHFQPWRHTGGHAPSALVWLGAIGQASRTSRWPRAS